MSLPARFRTGDRLIDVDTRELWHDGARLDVESKVFDLILLLASANGRALSKREIGEALWGHRPVTDAALSQLLRKARRALGDDGNTQRVIRTVHAHGLQWVGAIDADDPAPAPPHAEPVGSAPPARGTPAPAASPRRQTAWRIAGIALVFVATAVAAFAWHARDRAAEAAPRPVLAVAPVAERSGDTSLAWVSHGMMGLLAAMLAEHPDLDVVPSATVREVLADVAVDDAAQRRALVAASGTSHVVFAELDRVGPLHRLVVRLVGRDGIERRDELHGEAPAALAADAAARVRGWLARGSVTPAAAAESGIRDAFVAEAYARGLDAQLRGDLLGARRYFELCIDHDADLLWPRLRLATALVMTDDLEAGTAQATRVADAARERGDDVLLGEALRQLASVAYRRGDLDAATRRLDEALALPGTLVRPLFRAELAVAYGSIEDDRGRTATARGHFEDALAIARRAADRRREALVLANLAGVDNSEGDAERAAARLREALDAARGSGDAHLETGLLANLGATELNKGRPAQAMPLIAEALRIARHRGDRQFEALTMVLAAWTLAALDQPDLATRAANDVLAAGEHEDNAYWQAEAHATLGDLEQRARRWASAMDHLDRAYTLYASGGMQRNAAQVTAEAVRIATVQGDAALAARLADRYRDAAEAEAGHPLLRTYLPVIDAQLRHVGGDADGAMTALAAFVHGRGNDRGPATLAAWFQLARWRLERGQAAAVLADPAWHAWLRDHPDALLLRIAALEAESHRTDAAAERIRRAALIALPDEQRDPGRLAAR